jgi:hypothetical protein
MILVQGVLPMADPVGQFAAKNAHVARRLDSQLHHAAANAEHGDRDVVADVQLLVILSAEYKHVGFPPC